MSLILDFSMDCCCVCVWGEARSYYSMDPQGSSDLGRCWNAFAVLNTLQAEWPQFPAAFEGSVSLLTSWTLHKVHTLLLPASEIMFMLLLVTYFICLTLRNVCFIVYSVLHVTHLAFQTLAGQSDLTTSPQIWPLPLCHSNSLWSLWSLCFHAAIKQWKMISIDKSSY